MPSVGRIRTWRMPEPSNGLRIDAGYREGDAVSPHYDAMLAKVIAWAPTRDAAIERLNRGLEDSDVRGVVTNIAFLSALVTHPDVRANAIDTGFIERELKNLTPPPPSSAISSFARLWRPSSAKNRKPRGLRRIRRGAWPAGCRLGGGSGCSRSGTPPIRTGKCACITAAVRRGCRSATGILPSNTSPTADGGFDLVLDGMKSHVVAVIEGHELYLRTRNGRFDLHWVDPFGGDDEEQVGEDKIVAPLPGTVVALLAEVGATLEKGAPILTLEVMKMEQTLRAPFAGVLKVIKCKVGDIVQEGVELAEIEPASG